MKKELFIHFAYWFGFAVLVALIKGYINLPAWSYWLGGIVGTVLPDIDHILYFYFINPNELTSQRFDFYAHRSQYKRMLELLYETRTERKGLIFHTILFQLIFLILTFWMLSSSGSYFGRGLVLAFALHLSIDQLVDLNEIGNLKNWNKYLPLSLDEDKERLYFLGAALILLIFGLLL